MKTIVLSTAIVLMSAMASAQSDTAMMTTGNGKIGKMSITDFQAKNQKGNEMVAAITPSSKTLSAADQKLMMQVAAGGQMQLLHSQAALDNVQSGEVKILAQSEVEEQTGVAAKLKEIASAKGITLPDASDTTAQSAISKMQSKQGEAVDAYYVNESGVKGHIKLQATMAKVLATAKDADLKKLAAATLPVIKMHLSVSQDISRSMSGGMKKSAGAR